MKKYLAVVTVIAAIVALVVVIASSSAKQDGKFGKPLTCHTADGRVWHGPPCAAK